MSSPVKRVALAIVSGLLYWGAFPGVDVWPLAFVCWAPLLVAVHGQRARTALFLGFVCGLTTNLAGYHWLVEVIRGFAAVGSAGSVALMVAICAWNAVRVALMTWLYARATSRGWGSGVAFALALGASEVAFPLLFPVYAAAQLHSAPLFLQLAEIGGPILVSVAAAASSVALAEIASARIDRRPVDRARVLAVVAPIAMALFGLVRMRAVDRAVADAPVVRVGLVQGNLDHDGKKQGRAVAIHRARTATMKADLVVWPETAIGSVGRTEDLPSMLETNVLDGSIAMPVLTGAIVRRGPSASAVTNSAVLFEPSGRLDGVYDKVHPLAFGEYLPGERTFPFLRRWMPNAGNVAKGESLAPLSLDGHRISVLICYEDILAGPANDAVRAGDPELLVNITNDAWFGRSAAPRMHHALAKLRAVEHRRFLVRASNTGVSGFVDPAGRAFEETDIMTEDARVADLRWMRSRTIYEAVGDVPWWIAAACIVAMGLVSPARLRLRRVAIAPSTSRAAS